MNFSVCRQRLAFARFRPFAIATLLAFFAAPAVAQTVPLPPVPRARASSPSDAEIERAVGEVRYLVYIDSSRESRLREVRGFYPSATFGDLSGDRIIQAGLFEFEEDASDRQITLIDLGFDAEIAQVQVAPPERKETVEAATPQPDRGYYVVIPGDDARELDILAGSLRSLFSAPVAIRSEPFGMHAAIGPFGRRDDAEAIAEELQERDIDNARVHYERGGSLLEELF